jgi:hypothetical protein
MTGSCRAGSISRHRVRRQVRRGDNSGRAREASESVGALLAITSLTDRKQSRGAIRGALRHSHDSAALPDEIL